MNPTDEVGGSFIPCLQELLEQQTQNPTDEVGGLFIPNLQELLEQRIQNPTDEVGGLFIPRPEKSVRRQSEAEYERSTNFVGRIPNPAS